MTGGGECAKNLTYARLFQFNPLVWLAGWRLHDECERACDDLVLNSGVKASDYAEQAGGMAGTLAMPRPSRLEGRLLGTGAFSKLAGHVSCERGRAFARMAGVLLVERPTDAGWHPAGGGRLHLEPQSRPLDPVT